MPKRSVPGTITAKKRRDFLGKLAESANVTESAKAIGISRNSMYELRARDPDFAAEWDKHLQRGADKLEEEALRRAFGVEEPVFYKGEAVDTVKKYSDTLTIFLLKGLKPERYGDRYKIDHTVNDARDVSEKTSEELWAQLRSAGVLPDDQRVSVEREDN